MTAASRTNQELIAENALLKQKIRDSEQLMSGLKQGEEELKVSGEFLTVVLDNLWELIIVIDPVNYTILGANKTFLNSCGLDKAAVLGEHCYELTHHRSTPCSPPDDICPLADTLKTGKPSTVEHIHYDSAGNKLHVEVSTIPIISSRGEIKSVIHLSRDITEKKRAEKLLAENQLKLIEANQMLQLVIDTIPVRVFWKDLNLTYLGCNSLFARDGGWQLPADLIGKNDYDMGWREQADLYRQGDQDVIATAKPKINYEEPQSSSEGKHIWLRTSKVPLRDVTGFIIGVLGTYEDITERKQAEEQLQQTLESLRKAVSTTIHVMVSTVEARDPYTAGHQLKSADIARAIATEMGLSQEKIEGIRMAGSIHDIGKISIPAEILSKPTKLTDLEFSLIKEHARIGFELLKDVESPWPLAEIVYQHHERMDGSGYPRKLKGEDICIEARILTVADVVEAMASNRPYRPGLGINAALAEIEMNRGIFYDSDVADACLKLFREKCFQLAGCD